MKNLVVGHVKKISKRIVKMDSKIQLLITNVI